MREPTQELARSLAALYLATDASIADDVMLKVNNVVRDLTQRAEKAEAERDDIIAICRGTQVDDAAIHSMSEYVTEKLRIEAERDALRTRLDEWVRWGDRMASGHPDAPMASLDHEVRAVIANRYGMSVITAALAVQP